MTMTSAHNALVHSISQIAMTPVIWEPFPHYEVENIFPESYYQTLLARIPDLSFFIPENESISHFDLVIDLAEDGVCNIFDEINLEDKVKDFWLDFVEYYMGEEFVNLILNKYQTFPEENVYMTGYISRDKEGSDLGIYTERFNKVAVILYQISRKDICSSISNKMLSFKMVENIDEISSYYNYQFNENIEMKYIKTFIQRDIPINKIRED